MLMASAHRSAAPAGVGSHARVPALGKFAEPLPPDKCFSLRMTSGIVHTFARCTKFQSAPLVIQPVCSCGEAAATDACGLAGVRSPARVGSKRAAPEGDAAVNSSRRGAPPPALEQPAAARRRMAPPTLDPVAAGAQPAPAAADEGGGDRGGPRGNSSGGASVSALPGGPPAEEGATAGAGAADAPGLADSGAGEEQVPDAAGPQLQQGQQLLQLHLQQHEVQPGRIRTCLHRNHH